ncbi:hypothetical protein KAJ83_02475 [Marivibrio halodurans]|uniref:Sel1 repeat family protein n=1 Tax=Marivibrio halodurans TaxID=2039722 RepID=A0A8J7RWA6_9PROT|nr:hypothetical protein [Marivibrio halodurans]MBP5855857.1 hypothetical protein [Marivibrio halodurans]
MADPSIDVAPGVVAYEAGDYARAHDLLKPAADAGDLQARYLMARLLSGDLADRTDYQQAFAYLDQDVRCRSPGALALFAYVSWHAGPRGGTLQETALAYKEAALGGNLEALTGLGLLLGRDLERPLEGGAYLLEASELGEPSAIEFIESVEDSELGRLSLERLRIIVEEQPFAVRWPLLDDETTQCRF